MCCYTVPLAAAIATTLRGRKVKSHNLARLNLMLYGASLFGVIDHLWNGELFLVPANLSRDLVLGGVITAAVLAGWGIMQVLAARKQALPGA